MTYDLYPNLDRETRIRVQSVGPHSKSIKFIVTSLVIRYFLGLLGVLRGWAIIVFSISRLGLKINALVLLLFLSTTNVLAKTKLVNPETITVSTTLTLEQVEKAIKGAIIQLGWIPVAIKESNDNTKFIHASYAIRRHKLTLGINYSTKQIDFGYIRSTNLKYKNKRGKQYIHKNYMVWTKELAKQIKQNVDMGTEFSYEKAVANAPRVSNPPPKEAFKNFSQFKLLPTILATPYQGQKGNESTKTNLDHNFQSNLVVLLESLKGNGSSNRTLIIQPRIQAVKFIGTGARIWVGSLAGRSWIIVKLTITEEATGKIIAQPELYRIANFSNGFTVSRSDYQMVEDMALDITNYFERNYEVAVGGGVYPPLEIQKKIMK